MPARTTGSRLYQPQNLLSRKERKEHKGLKGGNGASVASGITQFANGEPKRRNYNTVLSLPTAVTLRRATGVNPWAYFQLFYIVVLARTSTLETVRTEKWIESPLFCPSLLGFRPE